MTTYCVYCGSEEIAALSESGPVCSTHSYSDAREALMPQNRFVMANIREEFKQKLFDHGNPNWHPDFSLGGDGCEQCETLLDVLKDE